MKRLYHRLLGGMASLLALASCRSNDWTALQEGFAAPPDSIRAAVYWYWLDNKISKDGVVKDLEAMKRVGITRAFIGNQSTDGWDEGLVPLFSDPWWDITHTALKKAGELGIEIGMFNCPGWSQSGGPWVTPVQSMKYVAGHYQEVEGNGCGQRLALPDVPADRIIAVQAWRKVPGASRTWTLKTREGVPAVLKMPVPFTVRSLIVESDGAQWTPVTLSMADKELASFTYDRHNLGLNVGFRPLAPWVEGLKETPPGTYELRVEDPSDGSFTITLSEKAYMPRYAEKTLAKMFQEPLPLWDTYLWDTPAYVNYRYGVDPTSLQNLTPLLSGGELVWKVPDGKWTVLVSYLESTGVTNSPAVPEGTGLEVDKMSRKHLAAHYDAFMGELLRRIPPEDRTALKVVVEDSYETGGQNWTDDMKEAFEKAYGYSPVPYLPVLQGEMVGSMEESERFLWDLRRLVADRVAYDYVGGLREKAHADDLQTWLECYGHWGFPSEFLLYGSQSDQIAGEFWSEGTLGDIENRAASSCGHIYGKNRIWAESCTAGGPAFNRYPRLMKQRLDRFFCEGINASLLHLYIQQPDDRQPGLDAWFGNEFNRNNTWFEGMGPFIEYLRRCNFMLQQGRYVADVAYFIGEDAPKMTGVCDPPLPEGYSFDYINADVLRHHARVRDGRLVLDSGMEYRVLVLPRQETMRPEVLEAIAGFVQEGLSVVGPAPTKSPSLQHGIFEADERVKTLAQKIWNGSGKGLVYPDGTPLDLVLADAGVGPDFLYEGDGQILFIHRSLGGEGDIYFISNQEDKAVTITPSFRAAPEYGAELWDPLSGKVSAWEGETLSLDRLQSLFVIFRKNAARPARPADSFCHAGQSEASVPDGPWTVEFAASAGNPAFTRTFNTLADWTESADEAVRSYSGHAVYKNTFTLSGVGKNRITLDLGEVMVLATVRVNGKDAGGVWTFPYRLDITDLVQEGANTLEITVYNNWRNRLIADENLPEGQRKTRTNIQPYGADDELQPSGLLGPISIRPLLAQTQERSFPLPVDESRSMLSRWAQKEVQASLLIDDMEQEGRWTVREGMPQLSYTRENRKDGIQALRQRVCLVDKETLKAFRTPWNTFGGLQGGATCVALEFEQPQDWSAYNRISLWVYIHPSRNPNVSFALDLITDTPDGSYTPSRETNVDIPQGKWVQVLWEIDAIKRDKVLRFELCQTCTGYDRASGEPVVTLDLDRLELQRVEPDHYEGWDLPAGHFAFAHTGYLPEASKVALAGPGKAARFSIEDRKGKTVFRGRARELAHKGNRFMELDFSRLRKEGRYRIRYGDALSEEFPIGPDVWEEPLWNVLNFYYCQRCGFPVEGIHGVCHADVQAFHDGEYKVVNGGWHDAGDLSQGFWRTAYGCYALLEALDVVPPSLRGRMADEARWGLRWLLKARFPEGRHLSWNTVRYYSDNVPGTLDDVASPATFIPWETLQGVAVFARAWETPDCPADEKANFAKAAKEDWESVMKALEWEQASTLEAAWGAVASALLYRHFQDGKYKEAALHFGERLLGCSFVTADTHAAFNEAPMLALSTLSEVFPEASAPWKEAARRHVNDFLKPGSRLSAPYYLLPAGEYPGKGVCTFPVWTDHVFHGATNIHLSQAWALAAAAALTEDPEAMELVQAQLEWTLGRNPFSSSLMYGVGYNFAPNFVYCTRHIAGAIPVGVDSFHDDSPFWNGTAHATAHEIWIEPVSRFLGTLAVYLKRF